MRNRFSQLIDRIQYVGVLLATILVPLLFYIGNQNIVIFKPLIAQIIMYFLMAIWFIDALENNKFELPETAFNGPIVAYMLWLIGTILISSYFWFYSIEELGRYLAIFLLFFLVQKTVFNRTRLRWILWILFATCMIATGWGMIQRLHQLGIVENTIVDWGREVIVSTFGNKNFFAGFLTMTAPVVFGYAWATKRKVIKAILFALFAIEFYILMATGTRTGFLGFWIGMIIFIFLLFRFVWFRAELDNAVRKQRLLVFGLVFLLMIGLSYLFIPQHLIERLGGAFDLQKGTQRVRWIMWTGSSRATIDQPITGHGHGTFQLVFPNYRPTFYHRFQVSHNTRHSHNEYLEVIMESGIVGLSLFLLLFVVLGVVSYRFIKRSRSQYYNYIIIGLLSGIVAGMVQNFASVNLRWMSSTYIFWLLVALLFAVIRVACGMGEERKQNRSINRTYGLLPPLSWKTPIYGLMVGFVALIGFGFYQLVQADFSLKKLNRYIQLAEVDRVSWDRAIKAGHESLEYSPFSLSTRYKLGYAYLQKQNFERARYQYDVLTDMAPNYAQIHNNIALIHSRFGNTYRSLLHFEWATALEDNLRNHLNLVQRYSQSQNTERTAYHSIHVGLLKREEIRNSVHLISIRDRGQFSRGVKQQLKEINQVKTQTAQVTNFLSRYFENQKPSASNFIKISDSLSTAFDRQTLSKFMQARQKNQVLDPRLVLGVARQLRGINVPQYRQFYKQTIQSWIGKDSDPLIHLAYAELLAQGGDGKQAQRVLESASGQIPNAYIYQDSVKFVKNTQSEA